MFDPADFDALIAHVEAKYAARRVEPLRTAHLTQALFVVRETRRLAESLGLMAPEPAPVRCQEERLAALLDQWEKRIEDLNKEFKIAKAAGRWQHVIQLEAYAVELMARRNEISDMLKHVAVRLCQECGTAPVNSTYSRLCEACYAIACEEIRAELAQEQAKEEPTQEEEPQEYILIIPGQEPTGNERLQIIRPSSAEMINAYLEETENRERWLPSAEILGSSDTDYAEGMGEMIAEREKERWFEGPEIHDLE